VPLIFAPGEAYRFDWSHAFAVLGGVTVKIKVGKQRRFNRWTRRSH
jgi:hypothetical protein